jgi:hypothetical protein
MIERDSRSFMTIHGYDVIRTIGVVFIVLAALMLVGVILGLIGIFFPALLMLAVVLFLGAAWWRTVRH